MQNMENDGQKLWIPYTLNSGDKKLFFLQLAKLDILKRINPNSPIHLSTHLNSSIHPSILKIYIYIDKTQNVVLLHAGKKRYFKNIW